MARPAPPEGARPAIKHRRVRRLRPWLIGLAAVILVVAALGGVYAWTQTQYFVGRAAGKVTIFQGVNTKFGPLRFFDVYRITDLPVANLNPSARSQVIAGITASSKQDAANIVSRLRRKLLPACSSTSPTLTPIPIPSPPATSSSHASSAHSSTAHTSPTRTSSAARKTGARQSGARQSGTHRSTSRPDTSSRTGSTARRTTERTSPAHSSSAPTSSSPGTPSPTPTCPVS